MKGCQTQYSRSRWMCEGWVAVAVIFLGLGLAALVGCGQGSAPAASTSPSASTAPTASSAPSSSSPQASAKPAATNTPDAKAREAALYEAAKKEGVVNFYASTSVNDAKALIQAFEKKYPGIKIEHYRATNEEVREKAIAEFKAGRYEADAYELGTEDHYHMVKESMLKKHNWPSAASYPKERIDPEGQWISTRWTAFVPAYNTNLVSAAEAPKTWEDLLDPKWKGKLGMEQNAYAWLAAMAQERGEDKALEYMRKLAGQNVQLRQAHTAVTQLLVAGEFAVAVETYPNLVEDQKEKKAPVEWVRVTPSYSAGALSASISVKAPHPNAAQLWTEWQTSNEGQQVYAALGRPPAKPDVPNVDPKVADQMKLKVVFLPPNWAEKEEHWRTLWQDLFWPKKN